MLSSFRLVIVLIAILRAHNNKDKLSSKGCVYRMWIFFLAKLTFVTPLRNTETATIQVLFVRSFRNGNLSRRPFQVPHHATYPRKELFDIEFEKQKQISNGEDTKDVLRNELIFRVHNEKFEKGSSHGPIVAGAAAYEYERNERLNDVFVISSLVIGMISVADAFLLPLFCCYFVVYLLRSAAVAYCSTSQRG